MVIKTLEYPITLIDKPVYFSLSNTVCIIVNVLCLNLLVMVYSINVIWDAYMYTCTDINILHNKNFVWDHQRKTVLYSLYKTDMLNSSV